MRIIYESVSNFVSAIVNSHIRVAPARICSNSRQIPSHIGEEDLDYVILLGYVQEWDRGRWAVETFARTSGFRAAIQIWFKTRCGETTKCC